MAQDQAVTDDEVKAALTDHQALTLTLLGEARGERIEGRLAVACVIHNRMMKGGRSAKSICLARSQFSCWWPWGGAANHALIMKWARTLTLGGAIPARTVLDECAWIAEGVLAGRVLDAVNGATHYYSPQAMKPAGAVPSWAKKLEPVATIGGHLFFRA